MTMNTKVLNTSHTKKEIYFIIFLLVGYVIVSSLSSIFQMESRYFSVPYRLLVFFFSVYILFKNCYFRKIDLKTAFIFSVFWIFYFIKTIYSFHNDKYFPSYLNQEYEVYLRIFIINLVPCLALLSIDYSKVDFKYLMKSIFWILFVMLALNLIYTVFYLNQFNNINGIFSVYYISSGHFGVSLVILSLYLLLFGTVELYINKKVLIIGLFLGLFAVYTSAARSPILALFIVGLYFMVLKKKIKYIYTFVLMLLLFLLLIYVSKQVLQVENAFIERNYSGIFEGNASGRAPYIERAISIFKDNVLIGGRVMYEDGMYPHNIFLELGMAGGLLLLLLFGLIFYTLLKNCRSFLNLTRSNFFILPLFGLWLQYFILTQTSNNIYSNPEFWYFSSVIIGISLKTYNEKT